MPWGGSGAWQWWGHKGLSTSALQQQGSESFWEPGESPPRFPAVISLHLLTALHLQNCAHVPVCWCLCVATGPSGLSCPHPANGSSRALEVAMTGTQTAMGQRATLADTTHLAGPSTLCTCPRGS